MWIDDAKKRSKQLMAGELPPGETTYALFRGLEDQIWTFERLEEIADLLRRGPSSDNYEQHLSAWRKRVEEGPTVDRAGGDWRKEV